MADRLYDTKWQPLETLAITPLEQTTTAEPGTIIERTKNVADRLWEGTVLAIDELQPAGKGRQDIAAFLNGSGQQIQKGSGRYL